ncbi:MAG: orotate phosphoribosyltransferase, partial [Acidobacteria bacterium]|nr:orotate phosphoribosyltransferase [Acidobacteriota bacterium]
MIPDLSTSILDRLRSASALMLWRAGAVRVDLEEPFRLASGNRSPIYVNCRQVLSDPVFMGLFLACARCLLADRGVASDAVAGGETAGIPYAAYLAQGLDRSMLYVRKKPKG